MKGFALDESGDVKIMNNDISMVSGNELLIQKIRQVLRTNQGEWWLQPKEGVPVQKILKKNPNIAQVKDYVKSAVAQVDSSLRITACDVKMEGRQMTITFSVMGKAGSEQIEMEV